MNGLAGMLRKEEEARSRFLLTSSVYRRCCESDCDCFLKLFATDEQASMVFAALKSVRAECAEKVAAAVAEEDAAEATLNQSTTAEAATEQEAATERDATAEVATEQGPTTEAALNQNATTEATPEQDTTIEATPEQDITIEATPEQDTTAQIPSQQPRDTTEKQPGTYLSLLLLHVLSAPVEPSLQTQVASLLLACFLHASSVDPLFEGLPVISDLFAVVCSDQEMNRFMDKQFSSVLFPR